MIGFAGVYDANPWLTYFPFNFAYTYGICVYNYVLCLTDPKRKLTARNLILFAPAVIYIVFRLVLFAQTNAFKIWFDRNYYTPLIGPLIFITEFIWNIFFLWLAPKYFQKYCRWLDENFSDIEKLKFDWLRNFLYVFTFVFVLGGVFNFIDNFISPLSYFQYF